MTTAPIRKILIANRGEVAIRIMRTCRAMGITSVAVYSDADLRAAHVKFADEAVNIGPPPATQSYLRIDRILEAARQTTAGAIHPGYGFLSENAEFAAACEAAGIVFIGPPAAAIRHMGLKSVARRLLSEAGVPIVPGYDGDDQSNGTLISKALEIGLPVLIKASAGGGGKGMRIVRLAEQLAESIDASRREAASAFGNEALLLEKFIEKARHVEVQIFGDSHGNLIHLLERECSIQRRHQKVIEESPSPALTTELRRRMCDSAVAAGRALGYTSAGTVEFILTQLGEFYFIEVNTRLQVEHPVTEMITGLDIVQLQIEVAEGHRLRLRQEDVRQSGHAIEARLYAEDPSNNFLPAAGTIRRWVQPSIAGVRVDTGIEEGAEVGIHYDPLLAKIVARGADRQRALSRLAYALNQTVIHGVETNRELLVKLLEHPGFQAGDYHTDFIADHKEELLDPLPAIDDRIAATVVSLYLHKQGESEARILPSIPLNYRNNPYRDPSLKLQIGTSTIDLSIRETDEDVFVVTIEDWQVNAQVISFDAGHIRLVLDSVQRLFRISRAGDQLFVQLPSGSRAVTVLPRYPVAATLAEQSDASAPMPGLVSRILVSVGQAVRAGEALIILEAMKMEQTLRAAADGVVEAILVKQVMLWRPATSLST
jgi:3-methylcrotonyl-CoA carboxylase alpha subunit